MNISRTILRIVESIYFRIYAPAHDWLERAMDKGDPQGPMPCQICGKPGHIESRCPDAERLGFGKRKER